MKLLKQFKKSHKKYNKLIQKAIKESVDDANKYYQEEVDFYTKAIRENIKRGFVNFKFDWDVPGASEKENVLFHFMNEFIVPELDRDGFISEWRYEYFEFLELYEVFLKVTPKEDIQFGDDFKELVYMKYELYAKRNKPEYEIY